jgi:hypothetical protein
MVLTKEDLIIPVRKPRLRPKSSSAWLVEDEYAVACRGVVSAV